MNDPPIIVALDLASAEDAVRMAKKVAPHVGAFKVGLGLLHGAGPGIATALVDLGKPVFADAKLHDIPSQVHAAARRLGRLGVRWVTAHISGGEAMLRAALEGLGDTSGGHAGLLGVTVLTSIGEGDLSAVGIQATPGKLVSKMSRLAAQTGCEGIVCSPQELTVVGTVAPGLLRVTPGVRPAGSGRGDQTRVMTPEEAMARGADWLVVGRPITAAPDPESAAAEIAAQVQIPGGTGER
ncbi:MAG: orotidine-5'-phosphate decarboxylase [Acidimicrobiia bacterium]|nr:orotidine-5'-phosphate decarboxylase [Acidimicrobiia bacterium]